MFQHLRPVVAGLFCLVTGVASGSPVTSASLAAGSDPLSWLEAPNSVRSQAWVRKENTRTIRLLQADPRYSENFDNFEPPGIDLRSTLLLGDTVYERVDGNESQSATWRRAFIGKPGVMHWESINFDSAKQHSQSVGIYDQNCLITNELRRCLLNQSYRGEMRHTLSEFDLSSNSFVERNPFSIPASDTLVAWRDTDTLLIADGLHSIIRAWHRGTPLRSSKIIFETPNDLPIRGLYNISALAGGDVVVESTDSRGKEVLWYIGKNDQAIRLPFAATPLGSPRALRDQIVFVLSQNWRTGSKTYEAGSLLAIKMSDVALKEPQVALLLAPASHSAIEQMVVTSNAVLAVTYQAGGSALREFTRENSSWRVEQIPVPAACSIVLETQANSLKPFSLARIETFLAPSALFLIDTVDRTLTKLASEAVLFDSTKDRVEVRHAQSADGEIIPYYLVRPLAAHSPIPTLLMGYGASGAFEGPHYLGNGYGREWLEKGGAYAVANIRGGGEFGARWAVRGVARRHTYDDFEAVARDLVSSGVTTSRHLGIEGYSSGGALVGVVRNEHPELFHVMIAEVPVLDILRYDLLAGGNGAAIAGTIFGQPSIPVEKRFLEHTSPYENLRYQYNAPVTLLITSTTDDNVSPAMARKYAAKLSALNMPYYFYETSEGGHGIYLTSAEHRQVDAIKFTFLQKELM